MSKLNKTAINLDTSAREQLVALLNQRVGLFTDLYVQTKLAHWNVRGPHFIAYHELFDSIAAHLLEAQDSMAERAATLGGSAGRTVQEIANETPLAPWAMGTRQDRDVIRVLEERLGQVSNYVREDIDTATKLGDADTADLFTEVSRELDHDLWFVEAHLQD